MDKEQEKMDALFQLLDELLEYPAVILVGTIGAYIFGAGTTIESWGATPEKTSTSTCEANS